MAAIRNDDEHPPKHSLGPEEVTPGTEHVCATCNSTFRCVMRHPRDERLCFCEQLIGSVGLHGATQLLYFCSTLCEYSFCGDDDEYDSEEEEPWDDYTNYDFTYIHF